MTCGSRTSLMLLQPMVLAPMLLIKPNHPPVIRLLSKIRLRMRQKIRPPHLMKQLQLLVTTRLLEEIKQSQTKQHQLLTRLMLQMKLALQMKLSSLLGDRLRLSSKLLISHLVGQLRNKDSLLRLPWTKAAIRMLQDQLKVRRQGTKPRPAVQHLSIYLLQLEVTRLNLPQRAQLDRPRTSLNTFSLQGRMLSFEVT